MTWAGIAFLAAGSIVHFFYKYTCYRIGVLFPNDPNSVDWGDMLFDTNDNEKRRKLTNLKISGYPEEAAKLARRALAFEMVALLSIGAGAICLAIGTIIEHT